MPLEPLPVNLAPELVFGLIAPIGVDLDAVSEVLNTTLHEMHYHAHVLRLTRLMRAVKIKIPAESFDALLPEQSLVRSYQERIAYANAIRGSLGDFALAALAISAIRSFRSDEWQRRIASGEQSHTDNRLHLEEEPIPNQAYIIRQLKRPEEVMLLREVYGRQFVLISAYASQDWRVRRIEGLEKESRGGLVSDIEARNRAQALVMQDAKESQDTHGQNVRDAFPLGDVFIDATSRVNCEAELRRFVHLLFGSNEITPTHDEYGSYLAKSASLRSSDLSRQVGAAIFRPSGEVLTLGCNEVPRAGGGTYWTGDESDARDFVKGSDPNEARKTQVLVDLVDRLHKGKHLSRPLMKIQDTNEISKLLLDEAGPNSIADSKVMDLIEFGRIVHAEMLALSDAARKGISVEGATLYCTTFPCHLCAKLIVAAGIKKVVYLEPYPKNYASDLHGDAIAVDSDSPGEKVAFNAFLGVSPFRYRDLFEKRKRKNDAGIAQRWNKGEQRPMINVLYPSYFRAEAYVVSTLGAAMIEKLTEAEVSPVQPQGTRAQAATPVNKRRRTR
jgi:deoxycytidylate deaminase